MKKELNGIGKEESSIYKNDIESLERCPTESGDADMSESKICEKDFPVGDNGVIRNINIREVQRGYIVEVGCSTFVFETKEGLLDKLTQYLNNPRNIENLWFNKKLF